MTIPVWPSTLPLPDRDTYQGSRVDPRLKRSTETGPPGYRRRYSAVPKLKAFSIIVGLNGKMIFDNFYDNDTAEGSLPFYMPDPTMNGWPLLADDGRPILMDTGMPMLIASNWLCTFGDTLPTDVLETAVEYKITFSITVMP